MDLFGDLPEPTQTSAPVKPKAQSRSNGAQKDGVRKRKAQEEQEEVKEEQQQEVKEEEVKRVCTEGLPELRGFVASRRGERDEMQDSHVLLSDMRGLLKTRPKAVSRVSFFAVFDGHGGARASRFAAQNLHQTLAQKFPSGDGPNLEKLIKKSLLDTFKQTDEDFLKTATNQRPVWKDGSTATCALVVDDTVYVANLGDSRAVLCRMEQSEGRLKPVTLSLSKEHNPTMYEERMRIQRAGGTVREGRVLGVLEVSRSLGDGQYKRCGVISTPDVRRCQLTHNDRFMLLACDGLFKVFSADEAVKFVLSILQKGEGSEEQKDPGVVSALVSDPLLDSALAPVSDPLLDSALAPVSDPLLDSALAPVSDPLLDSALAPVSDPLLDSALDSACQQLASEAVRRGCADNVTVILVCISFPK